ncbi:hypothetical protein BLL52_3977 [Rhodoferax antarcticus ANT.BR]|uniref:Uncharacterized protein n=1 Tax=Rhodoferax antarcticus ANT.BR TaxID=1111071 RepID=A0A1Q8YAP4_9BURK|nr:hypothetical protein BLL52_3977 [Rhodoferax antarcticus ANT.BR]
MTNSNISFNSTGEALRFVASEISAINSAFLEIHYPACGERFEK